jgi:hypothetical protein
MKKVSMALCLMCLLSGCSVLDFQFSTSQDDTKCLQENPSKDCQHQYPKERSQ